MNRDARAFVFNSAGLHNNSLARTGNIDFTSLVQRTRAFSADGDFLTYMNETVDPQQQIANALFLRGEVAGENRTFPKFLKMNPMKISFASPASPDGDKDPGFAAARDAYLQELDRFGKRLQDDFAAGKPIQGFPPVRAGQKETVLDSSSGIGDQLGAKDPGPTFGKLNQHLMKNVLDPMEKAVKADRVALQDFLKSCP